MPQRVLVAIDESEQSRRALDEAIDLFPDATLVLLNAFARGPADAAAGVGDDDGELDALRSGATRCSGVRWRVGPTTAPSRPSSCSAIQTPPSSSTPRRTTSTTSSSGSHSGARSRRFSSGSVAEEVVQRAPVSVTVAR